MTRSRKIEAAIKANSTPQLLVVGLDFTGRPIEEFTNKGADCFCPFINNVKLAQVIQKAAGNNVMHRDYPVNLPYKYDPKTDNPKNKHYHWAQIGLNSVQYCQLQKDPVDRNTDLCEKHFKKCALYQTEQKKEQKEESNV